MTSPTPPNSNRVPLFPRTTPAYPLPRQPTPPSTGNGLGFTTDPAGGNLGPNATRLALDYYSYGSQFPESGFVFHESNEFSGNPNLYGTVNYQHYNGNLTPQHLTAIIREPGYYFSYLNFILLFLVEPLIDAVGIAEAYANYTSDLVDDGRIPEPGDTASGNAGRFIFGSGLLQNRRTGQRRTDQHGIRTHVIGTGPTETNTVANWYLTYLRERSIDQIQTGPIANTFIDAYNANVTLLANAYDVQVRAINANPAVIDPYTFVIAIVNAQVKAVTDLAAGGVATITALAQSAINTVNGLKAGTVDPAIANAVAEIGRQQTFIINTVNNTSGQVGAIIANAQTELARQEAIIRAEVDRQKAAGEAVVNAAIKNAMATVESTTALILGLVGTVTRLVGEQVTIALNTVLGILANVQSQLADRPLYYGALAQPITVTNPTDVIVIPPGGLTITAN